MMNGTGGRGPSSGTHLNDLKRRIIRKLELVRKLAAEEKLAAGLEICRVRLFTEGFSVLPRDYSPRPVPIINDRSFVRFN